MSENQSDSLLPVATVIKKSSLKDANKPYDAFVLTEDATAIGEISIKLDEEVAKEFSTMQSKIGKNLEQLNSSNSQPQLDEKMEKVLSELTNADGQECKLNGRQNIRTFIKDKLCFEYVRINARLERKKAALKTYLEKAKLNQLHPHLKILKNPPSLPEFAEELYQEIRKDANELENKIRIKIAARLQAQLSWLLDLEKAALMTFLKLWLKNAKSKQTTTQMKQALQDMENVLKRRENASIKGSKQVQRKIAEKPPRNVSTPKKQNHKKRKSTFPSAQKQPKRHRFRF